MRFRQALALALAAQLVFVLAQLGTSGLSRAVLSGGFWVATLGLLIGLMEQQFWDEQVWLCFGTFSAAVVVGVLLSLGVVSDTIGVVVPLAGLLIVTALVVLMPGRRVAKRSVGPVVVALPRGKTFHRPGCRLVKGKETVGFASEEEARASGRRPCKACLNP
ncbi:MAG: hypothetical protein ACLFO2_01960 [Candidatus Woesearchaeota archaeon]